MARKSSPARTSRRKKSRFSLPDRRALLRGLGRVVGVLVLLGLPTLAVYLFYLDHQVRERFEGQKVSLPARVYARPLELFSGKPLSAKEFMAELVDLRYQKDDHIARPGTFSRNRGVFLVHSRGFRAWDGDEPARKLRLVFRGGHLRSLTTASGARLGAVRLDPAVIGNITAQGGEDRVLLPLEDAPRLLIDALLAVEDRDFFAHHGISLKAMLRALWANLRAGGVVQGGSTLTQQLVKNLFLGPERSIWRKLNEAVMAGLLEVHYSKPVILQAYLNEVYLGQAGGRAVHGFGSASQFWFDRPLEQLRPAEIALLVALVRGASFYNPRRHPQRARRRRDLVLDLMVSYGAISALRARQAKAQPLGISPRPPAAATRYPAFFDLLRRQLLRDYSPEVLAGEGLQIHTTLDPRVQQAAERALARELPGLERRKHLQTGSLQGAVVVASSKGGEMLALVGGRDVRFSGFNRALDALRPIGSLAKPAVYLTALEEGYTLISPLEDRPLRVKDRDRRVWSPRNFDKKSHGRVPLYQALAHSYNQATVRLGLQVGGGKVLQTFRELGVRRPLEPYPSLFLGASALTPLEVTQMVQTLAGGGFAAPLRAIREVLDPRGRPVQRYPLRLHRVVDEKVAFLLQWALTQAVREGTGRGLKALLPKGLTVAGKTGTTNDLRDSWFAGFSGDRVAVVWLGRDDNRSAGLTGSSGALRVWGRLMASQGGRPLELRAPPGVHWQAVELATGRAAGGCSDAVRVPFIVGTEPRRRAACAGGGTVREKSESGVDQWLRSLFED